MAVTTHFPISDADTVFDDGFCSEDSNASSVDECDTVDVSRASRTLQRKLRQREEMDRFLRSLIPLRQMVPRRTGSLAEDTVAYVQQLRNEIQSIESEIDQQFVASQRVLLANQVSQRANKPPEDKLKVEMKDSCLEIEVECEKRPGLALALSKVIDGLHLTILHARMSCEVGISFYIISEKAVGGVIVDTEHVKSILQQTINSHCDSPCVGT